MFSDNFYPSIIPCKNARRTNLAYGLLCIAMWYNFMVTITLQLRSHNPELSFCRRGLYIFSNVDDINEVYLAFICNGI